MSGIHVKQSIGDLVAKATSASSTEAQAHAARDAELMPALTEAIKEREVTQHVGRKGDLIASCGWRDFGSGRQIYMQIAAASDPVNRHVWFPMNQLWQIMETWNVQLANSLCERLFGFVTKQDAYRLLDAMFDFGEDIIRMKPIAGLSNKRWLEAVGADGIEINYNGQAING